MRRGVTLVELLVVLLLLSLLAGMSALAAGRLRGSASGSREEARRMATARAEAIRTGGPVRLMRDTGGPALFLPDGRAVGRGIDPLMGSGDHAPR